MVIGPTELTVDYTDLGEIEIFRQHAAARVIRVQTSETNLFMTVPGLNVFGIFAIINYVKTHELFDSIRQRRRVGTTSPPTNERNVITLRWATKLIAV